MKKIKKKCYRNIKFLQLMILAGALGFEPRMSVPKTDALPLGYAPMACPGRVELPTFSSAN
tara:strand:- start:2281 stop:2463 length:183 start_codon:yes stop_codon:yes gene_type:complete